MCLQTFHGVEKTPLFYYNNQHQEKRFGGSKKGIRFSKKFFETQPVLPGAVEFVHDLQEYGKVFFVTDVQQEYHGIRKSRLLELFPEIPEEHIIITPRKEEANVDVLLDDGIHNLRRTTAEYPVLMQRPWNAAEKNYITVSGFEEFLAFMGSISI